MRIYSYRNLLLLSLLTMFAAGILTGCKPTEKNYRSAYDAALGKRAREDSARRELNRDLGIEQTGTGVLQEVDGARFQTVRGHDVWMRNVTFSRADSIGKYSVGAAVFRMRSNARAMAADLRAEGYTSAKDAEAKDEYFVILDSFDSLDPALDLYDSFSKAKGDAPVVGAPGLLLLVGGSPGR